MARYSFHAFHIIRIFKRVLLVATCLKAVFGETLPYFFPFFRDKLPQNPSQASMSFWESSAMAAAAQLRTQVLLHHLELDKKNDIWWQTVSHTVTPSQVCTQECKVSSPGSRTSSPMGSATPKTNCSNDTLMSAPPKTGRAHPQSNRSNGILIRHYWQKK